MLNRIRTWSKGRRMGGYLSWTGPVRGGQAKTPRRVIRSSSQSSGRLGRLGWAGYAGCVSSVPVVNSLGFGGG